MESKLYLASPLINTEVFQAEWNKILIKLEEISQIPMLSNEIGKDFDGVVIDEDGITYKTSTWFNGCGEENYSFSVSFAEINNSIEYFRKKYKDEFEEEKQRQEIRKRIEEENTATKERQLYLELKKKYK